MRGSLVVAVRVVRADVPQWGRALAVLIPQCRPRYRSQLSTTAQKLLDMSARRKYAALKARTPRHQHRLLHVPKGGPTIKK